jgi:hypothetical protein
MTITSLSRENVQALVDALLSHVQATGMFDRVAGYEPKRKPGTGLTAACWMNNIAPVPKRSGLAVTTALVVMNLRLYSSIRMEPPDAIDPNLSEACAAIISRLSADFTLDGLVSSIDLLGAYSGALQAPAGYVNQDGEIFRVYTISVPCVIDDLWGQAP